MITFADAGPFKFGLRNITKHMNFFHFDVDSINFEPVFNPRCSHNVWKLFCHVIGIIRLISSCSKYTSHKPLLPKIFVVICHKLNWFLFYCNRIGFWNWFLTCAKGRRLKYLVTRSLEFPSRFRIMR